MRRLMTDTAAWSIPYLVTGTISVPVRDDSDEEEDETFTVTLSGASGATIVDGEGVGTITDDDHAELTVSYGAASYTVTEGSTVAVTVVLSKPPGTSVTIPLTHIPVGAVHDVRNPGSGR